MTRSERIQEAIDEISNDGYLVHDVKFIKTILLAEQKRSEGCDSCHDKNLREIMMVLGWTHCAHCGRDLTEGGSV